MSEADDETNREYKLSTLDKVVDVTIKPSKNEKLNNGERYPLLEKEAVANDNQSETKSRVIINVGGVIFQTLESTILNTPLRTDQRFHAYYDENREEYFFDRDPEVFNSILNYWRTGKLHLPHTRCGSQMKDELQMWGLTREEIQPCCWSNYHSGLQTVMSLKKLRHDINNGNHSQYQAITTCSHYRLNMWYLLTKPSHSKVAKVLECFSILFILLAIFSFCLSTHPFFQISMIKDEDRNLTPSNRSTLTMDKTKTRQSSCVHSVLEIIDIVCLTYFTIEYLVHAACAPKLCKFLLSATSIVDIVAILPDYVEILLCTLNPEIGYGQIIMKLLPFLRLMRVCRIFRIIRRVPGLWIMIYTLKASHKELSLLLIFLLVGTLLFSSAIYFVDDHTVFISIPHSFWWAIITMTTVGYGDMTPVTPWGQLIGSIAAVCGVLMLGFTVPALVTNFTTYYNLMEYETRQKNLLAKAHLFGQN